MKTTTFLITLLFFLLGNNSFGQGNSNAWASIRLGQGYNSTTQEVLEQMISVTNSDYLDSNIDISEEFVEIISSPKSEMSIKLRYAESA